MEGAPFHFLDSFPSAAFHPGLSDSEKAIRDAFAREYVDGYNHIEAAIRVGFLKSFAEDYAHKFLAEPYVQQKIKELEADAGASESIDVEKRRVMAIIRRESQYKGAGSAHGARVMATMYWAKLLGMEPAPKDSEKSVVTPEEFAARVLGAVRDADRTVGGADGA